MNRETKVSFSKKKKAFFVFGLSIRWCMKIKNMVILKVILIIV